MIPQWLEDSRLVKAVLFILIILASAIPAASQWRTVQCSSDFGDGALCCRWCFFWGCDDCAVLIDPPATVVHETP